MVPASRDLLERALSTIEDLEARLREAERGLAREPVAIIGIGCRLPGGVRGPEAYWQLLREGRIGLSELPAGRWPAGAAFDVVRESGAAARGGFLEDVDLFDAGFFGLSPREAAHTDPQHRLALETAWETLEDGGYATDESQGRDIGVFLGLTTTDYAQLLTGVSVDLVDAYYMTGNSPNFAAGRIAHALHLRGPAMVIDAACSSSLVAANLAFKAVQTGECAMALAGGVNLLLSPLPTIATWRARMLSSRGAIRPFDGAADGILRGEGCGFVLLKKLSRALEDGDQVRAVILGGAVNHNAGGSGITVPSVRAQEELLSAGLERAGVTPGAIGYVEAHGTGTPLGDPIELEALGRVFSRSHDVERPLLIGSVKANLGHLESAAGVAGLIKAVLSIERGQIPGQPSLDAETSAVDWGALPVRVPKATVPWPTAPGRPTRHAGVTALGGSGTNAHVVLAEGPAAPGTLANSARPAHLLPLSARSPAALRRLVGRFVEQLETVEPSVVRDVCFTAQVGRGHFRHRVAAVGSSGPEIAAALASWAQGSPGYHTAHTGMVDPAQPPRIVALFTGQGSQHLGMGRGLYDAHAVFRATLDRCDRVLRPLWGKGLLDLIWAEGETAAALHQTGYAQAAIFSIQAALTDLWRALRVEPSLVIGHSIGEFAAAYAAGVLSLETGLALVAERGRLMQLLPGDGAMAAVLAGEARVRELLEQSPGDVEIAAVNGPRHLVLSGPRDRLQAALSRFQQAGIPSVPLEVSHAFHSRLMDPVTVAFEAFASRQAFAAPRVPFISSLLGRLLEGPPDGRYWARQVREPVRFAAALAAIEPRPGTVFLEVGPRLTLTKLSREGLGATAGTWAWSMDKGSIEWATLLGAVKTLHVCGAPIRWSALHEGERPRRVSLPTYPFEGERHWFREGRGRASGATHATAGSHPMATFVLETPKARVVGGTLSLAQLPLLGDHRIRGKIVVPASFWLDAVLSAVVRDRGAASVRLSEVAFRRALVLGDKDERTVQLTLEPLSDSSAHFDISSRVAAGTWEQHANGTVSWSTARLSPPVEPEWREPLPAATTAGAEALAARLAAHGIELGPRFRWIECLSRDEGRAWSTMRYAAPEDEASRYVVPPGLIDSCLQVLAATPGVDVGGDDAWVPFHVEALSLHDAGRPVRQVRARLRRYEPAGHLFVGDLALLAEDDFVVAEIRGLSLRRLPSVTIGPDAQAQPLVCELSWPLQALAPGPTRREPPSAWYILSDDDASADALREALTARGAQRVECLRPLEGKGLVVAPGAGFVLLPAGDAEDATESADTSTVAASCGQVARTIQVLLQQPSLSLAGVWIVTRGAQGVEARPEALAPSQASLWGLGRVIANEHPELSMRLVDLDPSTDDLSALCDELLTGDDEEQVAYRGGRRHVARLVEVAPAGAAVPSGHGDLSPDGAAASSGSSSGGRGGPIDPSESGVSDDLTTSRRGDLGELRATRAARPRPEAGEVLVEVAATGLNFRDVLNALGMYPGGGPFGGECAGRISDVGDGVDPTRIGEEVAVLFPKAGAFGRFVTAPAEFALPRPRHLTDADAAGIPVAFLTALYGLDEVGRLRAGDRVLIHAAAGGVGLAAVQVARRAGAEIFATASPSKWAYLRSVGVHRLASSRDPDFAKVIRRHGGGEGVDIVLNSLTGAFISESLKLLRRGGRFVELGKREIWSRERVARINPDVVYVPFDLLEHAASDRAAVASTYRALLAEFERGALQPLPRQDFALSDVQEAFRHMSRGHHVGKVVITRTAARTGPSSRPIRFRPGGSYVVTGGMGGLGTEVARWLAERGAGEVVLVGRRVDADRQAQLTSDLQSRGCRAVSVAADVADRPAMTELLGRFSADLLPLRGVVHAAGVLEDAAFAKQEEASIARVLAPKVDGALLLDELTRGLPLDFMVFFSSASATIGNPGQAAYAAANAFLGTLAHQRRMRGLKATAIEWGPWRDLGMNRGRSSRWESSGLYELSPAAALEALETALASERPHRIVLALDLPRFVSGVQRASRPIPLFEHLRGLNPAPRPAALGPAQAASGPAQTSLRERLQGAPERLRAHVVEQYLRGQLVEILALQDPAAIDLHRGFVEQGLDSLMGLELRNRLQVSLGCALPASVALDHPTVHALARHLVELAAERHPRAIEREQDAEADVRDRPDGRQAADPPDEDVLARIEQELALVEALTAETNRDR